MGHRTVVAEAIKVALAGKLPAGTTVHTSLDRALGVDDLPAVIIYTPHSRRGKNDSGHTFMPRIVTVNIEGAVVADPNYALADAEALADAVETAIEADRSLGNVVQETTWQQTQADIVSRGEHTLGACLLEYEVEIATMPVNPFAVELHDDGFVTPPSVVFTQPGHGAPDFTDGRPKPPGDVACGPDGCDLPAWGGEVNAAGQVQP